MDKLKEYRIIVFGSFRGFEQHTVYEILNNFISSLSEDFEVIILTGEEKGVPLLARSYATEHGIKLNVIRIKWEDFGRTAGLKRAVEITDLADAAVFIYHEGHLATLNMIKEAKIRNLKIFESVHPPMKSTGLI